MIKVFKQVGDLNLVHQLSENSVPFSGRRIQASVLPVADQLKLVLELHLEIKRRFSLSLLQLR